MRRLRRTMVREDALRSRCSLYNLYSAPRIFASKTLLVVPPAGFETAYSVIFARP